MYDSNGTPVPTAALTSDVLASMPSDYQALHADYRAAVKALHDADDALDDAREAERAHRAEVYASSRDGKKAPASIAPEVFAGRIAAAEAKRNDAYRAASRAAAAIDNALIVTTDAPEDAPGRVAARLIATQLANAVAAEREAIEAAQAASAARASALKSFQHTMIVMEVGEHTDAPHTIRFGGRAAKARQAFTAAVSDPNWILTKDQPTDAEAYAALGHSTDIAHKALLLIAPVFAGDDVPERVNVLKEASIRKYAQDIAAADHLRWMAGHR